QAVGLGLVEEQEERAETIDAVMLVGAVETSVGDPSVVERLDPVGSACPQLVERPELDRVGGARLRARGLEAVAEPVVAEGAFPGAAVILSAVDHAERTRRDAVS